MGVKLDIRDETTSGKVAFEGVLDFPIECISVRQLIEARVDQEIENYISKNGSPSYSLFALTKDEELLNGKKLTPKKWIDPVKQKKIAIHAFENNAFFLLVNDHQLTELDDTIIITPSTSVTFLKLVPLVGG